MSKVNNIRKEVNLVSGKDFNTTLTNYKMENNKLPDQSANPPVTPPPIYRPYVPRSATSQYKEFKGRVTSQKGFLITVLSVILSVLFTETILLGSAGISIPIFAIAFYGVLFYFFRESGKELNKASVYISIPILLLSLSFFIHYNPSTQFITWLTLVGLVFIQLILLSNIHVTGIFSFDMLAKVFKNIIGRSFINLAMPFYSFGILKENKSRTFKNTVYIFIGLGISLPVAAILMGLFMSADAVFANAMETLIDFIGIEIDKLFADIALGLFFGLFVSSALLGLKYENKEPKTASKLGDSINSIIIGTFLTIINIFIIAFVAFQFVYLFGGSVNITVSDMTYAEYARRGFFELSAASGIIFVITLFVIFMTKKKEEKLPLWIQLTTVALCLCNGVLLASALKRMLLYVDVYGLSVKRLLTLWFMGIIGFCLLWLIIKCFATKVDVMKWIGMTVIIGVCVLSLTNTERLIAKYNVNSYLENPDKTSIDLNYLGYLSYTAVPEINRIKNAQVENVTDAALNAILTQQKNKLEYRHRLYGFTLDRIKADRILSEIK